MKRLTKRDWQTINAALAVYEAEDIEAYVELPLNEDKADEITKRWYDQIATTRARVHERLARYKNPYGDDDD